MSGSTGQVKSTHEQEQAGKPIRSWPWHQVWSGAGSSGEHLTALPVDSESILLWTWTKKKPGSHLVFGSEGKTES